MRILTLVRQVPDAEETIRIREGKVDLASSKLVVDTMDEYGIEQALRFREQGLAEEVVAVGVGPARMQDALRTALAMGADWDSHALGAAVAERLNWPQATWTNALELNGNTLKGRHDTDEGSETFELPLPAVVTTQQGLNEPRYPTVPNIMRAKKKEIRAVPLEQSGAVPLAQVTGSEIQVKARRNQMLDGKDAAAAGKQLVELLRNEARVIQ
jgi:electron transfer flavoprotein beta subunit